MTFSVISTFLYLNVALATVHYLYNAKILYCNVTQQALKNDTNIIQTSSVVSALLVETQTK